MQLFSSIQNGQNDAMYDIMISYLKNWPNVYLDLRVKKVYVSSIMSDTETNYFREFMASSKSCICDTLNRSLKPTVKLVWQAANIAIENMPSRVFILTVASVGLVVLGT